MAQGVLTTIGRYEVATCETCGTQYNPDVNGVRRETCPGNVAKDKPCKGKVPEDPAVAAAAKAAKAAKAKATKAAKADK